jgi:DNA-directed RNA polymerase subunit RPC12/RpoP
MANQTYKCLNCGGELNWDPASQKLKCPYCGSEFDLSVFEQKEEKAKQDIRDKTYEKGASAEESGQTRSTDDTEVRPEDLRVYKCSVCGAEVITDKTTVATSCAFCGNPVILEENLDTQFHPDAIIPFRISREEIKGLYTQYLKSRPFTPRDFYTDAHIQKIKGIYVPFWLYDMPMEGQLHGTGERVSSYSDSNYIYTKHDVFEVEREGTLQIDSLPVDASSKMPDEAVDSIEPFDYKDLAPFKMAYMPGFFAERYDEDASFCSSRALKRAGQTTVEMLRGTVTGYSSVTVTGSSTGVLGGEKGVRSRYVLMPVYLLYTKYKGKDYLFSMNGQTGKAVGNVPIDGKRAALFWLIRFPIVLTAALLINLLIFA